MVPALFVGFRSELECGAPETCQLILSVVSVLGAKPWLPKKQDWLCWFQFC